MERRYIANKRIVCYSRLCCYASLFVTIKYIIEVTTKSCIRDNDIGIHIAIRQRKIGRGCFWWLVSDFRDVFTYFSGKESLRICLIILSIALILTASERQNHKKNTTSNNPTIGNISNETFGSEIEKALIVIGKVDVKKIIIIN